jgi:PPOX class probable F420-dependent enzyme
MTTAMTKQEREAFLAEVRVGILSVPQSGRGPLSAPIWYAYEPGGDVVVLTGRDSRKGRLLAPGARVSLCVQTETRPYKYVTVEGPVVTVEARDVERDLRPMAVRYLGREQGDQYAAAAARTTMDSVLVRIRPEHWLTVDYGKAEPSGDG